MRATSTIQRLVETILEWNTKNKKELDIYNQIVSNVLPGTGAQRRLC
jgi:hypothetical protein